MKSLGTLYNNEMQLLNVCKNMELHGVLLDTDYVGECLGTEQQHIREAREDFEAFTGRAYKNSSKLFAEIFAEGGINVPRTSKGNDSVVGAFLDHCKSPVAKRIKAVREHEKRANTYFVNLHKLADADGWLHPSMNQAGTVTGRFSYSNPNLQNVPKDLKSHPTNVRRAFIPPEGYKMLSIDYSQMEYRIMLDYAGQMDVIDRVMKGEDLHQVTADLLGVKRETAKTLNFAILYGTGSAALGAMLGCDQLAAQVIKAKYFRGLPKVSKLLKDIKSVGERRGHIENRFGRRYRCADLRMSYKLPNYLIQGTGADVIKHAMVEIDSTLKMWKTKMVLQVHDELLFYLAPGEDHIIELIQEKMEGIYPSFHGMKLTTDVGISDKSWGDI